MDEKKHCEVDGKSLYNGRGPEDTKSSFEEIPPWVAQVEAKDGHDALSERKTQSRKEDIEAQSIASTATTKDSADTASAFWSSWSLYLASTFGSILALVALYGLLIGYNNREPPRFPYTFTINSVIAIMTVCLKMFMLMAVSQCIGQLKWAWFNRPQPLSHLEVFDCASRGELWSSVQLIFIQKSSSVATIGAMIVIFAMIIEPFTQQAVQYVPCTSQNTSAVASVPISRHFVPTDMEGTFPADAGLAAAFYSGLLNQGRISAPGRLCPSGNCNYERYQTMSFCSACRNEADKSRKTMEYRAGETTFEGWNFAADEDWCHPTILELNITTTEARHNPYSLPLQGERFNNVAMQITPWFRTGLERFADGFSDLESLHIAKSQSQRPPFFVSTVTGVTQNESCTFDWMDGKIRQETDCINPARYIKSVNSSIDTSRPAGFCTIDDNRVDFMRPVDLWPNVTSSSCAVYVCAKQYTANVRQAGQLSETLLDTSPVLTFAGWKGASANQYMFIPSPCLVDGELVPTEEFIFLDRDAGVYPDYGKAKARAANHSERAERLLEACTYRMATAIGVDIGESFSRLMWGKGNMDLVGNMLKSTPQDSGRLDASWIPWARSPRVFLYWGLGYYLESFFNKGWASHETIANVYARMARAMEIYMREADTANSTAPGVVIGGGTCITIDLRWLVFPTVVVAINVVFLLLTMLASRSGAYVGGIWANQQLPLLFSGLSSGLKKEIAATDGCRSDMKKIKKLGETFQARLVKNEDGEWRFCQPA